jgi:hypothetical protein
MWTIQSNIGTSDMIRTHMYMVKSNEQTTEPKEKKKKGVRKYKNKKI